MSGQTHDRNTKAYLVASIASLAAPTADEMAAGTRLLNLTSDGIALSHTRNKASLSLLDDAFIAENVGNWGVGITLKHEYQGDGDTMLALYVYGTETHLVIARGGDGTTAADEVEVYPIEMHNPEFESTAENEKQKFMVQLAVTATPSLSAVVAA